jgi:two-component system sensor histidine kinase/response regulator
LFTTIAKWVGDKITVPDHLDTHGQYYDVNSVPAIEGVDTPDVLARLMGDTQLYEALFRQFLADYQQAYSHFQQYLMSDPRSAERLVHSMKGVAGTLGMNELAAVSAQLEQQLRQHPGQPDQLEVAFERSLRQMLEAVAMVYPLEGQSNQGFSFDTPEIVQLFNQLEVLIQNCDGDAVDEFEQLKRRLSHWPDQKQLDRLGYAISNEFNFEHAQRYLAELKTSVLGAEHG